MKRICLIFIVLLSIVSFSSCGIMNALLGVETCDYPNCSESPVKGCNYCIIHCDKYNVPEGLGAKVDKSIKEQVDRYRKSEGKELERKKH